MNKTSTLRLRRIRWKAGTPTSGFFKEHFWALGKQTFTDKDRTLVIHADLGERVWDSCGFYGGPVIHREQEHTA